MIPCNIQTVADEDILELQVTENLQRKDVHPMDEAVAFRSLIEDKHYSPEEIAARFGKKIDFITHRLKLNDLLPELQKAFKKNILTAGQAFVICRLRKEDQAILRKEWKDDEFPTASIHDVQEWIDGKLLRNLSKVAFKKDDATLDTKAGPCNTCTKRSGCGNLLFADLKEDDRCFDAACFDRKLSAFFLLELKKVIETKPDVHIIARDAKGISKDVKEILRQMNVPILDSANYQTYSGWGKFKKPAKGFYLDGYEKGRVETIYVEGPAKAEKKTASGKPAKRTAKEIDDEIAGIKSRQDRAAELDVEKIHKATLLQLKDRKEFEKPGLKHQGTIDRGIMVFLLLEKAADYRASDVIEEGLKKALPKKPDQRYAYQPNYFMKLAGLSDDDIAFICRAICMAYWGDPETKRFNIDEEDTTMRLIAEYLGIDVKSIEATQRAEAAKRIERANTRIAALKKEKKDLGASSKKEPAVAKKAPAKKKVGKPKNTSLPPLKRLVDMDDEELDGVETGIKDLLEDDPDDWK
jgi:ParB-like chromosome segregation protein Spo0J